MPTIRFLSAIAIPKFAAIDVFPLPVAPHTVIILLLISNYLAFQILREACRNILPLQAFPPEYHSQ